METILGSGTASVKSRELGRDFEAHLIDEEGPFFSVTNTKKAGLWINPGHKWGGIHANTEYSLSQNLVLYVLFGVKSGVGEPRRMMLSTSSSATGRVAAIKYNVDATSLLQELLPGTIAESWVVIMAINSAESCLPVSTLKSILVRRFAKMIDPYASPVRDVQVVTLSVELADCEGARRRSESTNAMAIFEAVIAFEDVPRVFLDLGSLMAADNDLVSMRSRDGIASGIYAPRSNPESMNKMSGSEPPPALPSSAVMGAAAGVGGGVMLVCGFLFWKLFDKRREIQFEPPRHHPELRLDEILYCETGTMFAEKEQRIELTPRGSEPDVARIAGSGSGGGG
eukprot:2047701-Rhodomonas_salina.6